VLQLVFDLIIDSLLFLQMGDDDGALFECAHHVLQSLATVRSCCVLSELANDAFASGGSHAELADAQIIALMNNLLNSLGFVHVLAYEPVTHSLRLQQTCRAYRSPLHLSVPSPLFFNTGKRHQLSCKRRWWTCLCR